MIGGSGAGLTPSVRLPAGYPISTTRAHVGGLSGT